MAIILVHLEPASPVTLATSKLLPSGISGSNTDVMSATMITQETRQEKLFAPQDSQGVADKSKYDALFGVASRRNLVYFTTIMNGGNVLTSSVLAEVHRFDSMARNIYVYAYKERRKWDDLDGGNYSFADVCVKALSGGCASYADPLELFARSDGSYDFRLTDSQILDIVNSGRGLDPQLFPPGSNRTLNIGAMFGGITRDTTGRITSAASIALTYSLIDGDPGKDGDAGDIGEQIRWRSEGWEDQLNVLVGSQVSSCALEASPSGCLFTDLESPRPLQWTNDPVPSRGAVDPDGRIGWSSATVDIYPYTYGAINREFRRCRVPPHPRASWSSPRRRLHVQPSQSPPIPIHLTPTPPRPVDLNHPTTRCLPPRSVRAGKRSLETSCLFK